MGRNSQRLATMVNVTTKVVSGVYTVAEANDLVTPVVFDSPHSGIEFPADFQSSVAPSLLTSVADLYVDELYADAVNRGAAFLKAHFPRVYVDANRPLSDLDESLLSGTDRDIKDAKLKGARGIGLIWTLAPDQSPIYDAPLTESQMRRRVDRYWVPYQAMLDALLAARRNAFGAVWHVNCHSMPGAGTKLMGDFGNPRPDIIIGTRDGTTCSPEFETLIAEHFSGKGFDTRVNELFKGADIVRRCGDPANGRHSVQIEINKSLYMDEQNFDRLDSFQEFRDDVIAPLMDAVCAYAAEQCPGCLPDAIETAV